MKITKEMVFESVRMKRNWCSPGDVKITNYWIKRVHVFHQEITTALNVIIGTDSSCLLCCFRSP